MSAMKTPGVYIVEKNAFPNSVVEASTAVPAFVGYTQWAKNGSKSLLNKPFKVSSLAEFNQYFGYAPSPQFSLSEKGKETSPIYIDSNNVKNSIEFLLKSFGNLKKEIIVLDKLNKVEPKDDEAVKSQNGKIQLIKTDYVKVVQAFYDGYSAVFTPENIVSGDIKSILDILAGDEITLEQVTTIEGNFNQLLLKIIPANVVTQSYDLKREDTFNLYYNLRLFFANGGGQCYIVSVGGYESGELSKEKLINGVDTLVEEQEPTMVLVPEAVYLPDAQNCYDVQTAMLNHCGHEMRNRFAILDIYDGYKDRKDESGDMVNQFREKIGTEFLDFAATYYPWLHTSVVSDSEIDFSNITKSWDILKNLLLIDSINLSTYIDDLDKLIKAMVANEYVDPNVRANLSKVFSKQSWLYINLINEMKQQLNLLAPGAGMAGIYTLVDSTKEVWKAPANIGFANVISPAVNISNATQEDLNVPINGKAVNAIRYFVGDGIKVWGARTLDGNSLDWRYINVRRTMIMLEESIKNATKAFVFDPNTANTWVSVRSMISNFLNGIWKRGGLAGAIPDDAFSVHIGLGETMTPEDILEGIMRVTVLVALVRPAEFIEITFQQQMQKS